MNSKLSYTHTMYASFIAYVVQAIGGSFIPLLFATFTDTYGISISKITFLVTLNFGLQLIVDLVSTTFIDRIGYKTSIVIAHILSALGFILLTILPNILSDAFTGLLISVMIYSIGGGLIEVLVSPIVEACPTDNKQTAMSLLHSFYCWGCVGVILISTIFFSIFGIDSWKVLCIIWAIVPTLNGIFFTQVPIGDLVGSDEKTLSFKELFANKVFWIMLLLMVCAGASEQAVSQWASTFAEKGLGVSKTIGDLAGPMFFAILMGTSRAIYAKFGDTLDLKKFMYLSGILCVISYLLISLSPWEALSLIGCGLCGLSVGIMWPGTISLSKGIIKGGGTVMFALLALAGDVGCSGGPTFVGLISGFFDDNLKLGILMAIVFPLLLVVSLLSTKRIITLKD
ncbi:MAG: MFS transporter [Ruminococcus sp.]|nr:MFS transporter [Ruminococcus sp.]MCD7801000.1 MFS transporter [Ruminococcus sp.]